MPVAIRRAIEEPSRAESILGKKEAFHGQGLGKALAYDPIGTIFCFFFCFLKKKKERIEREKYCSSKRQDEV